MIILPRHVTALPAASRHIGRHSLVGSHRFTVHIALGFAGQVAVPHGSPWQGGLPSGQVMP